MLINCAAYQNGSKLTELSIEDISEHIKEPDRFVWVALKNPTDQEIDTMGEEFGLHELAIEDAKHGHQRPKIEEYRDTLFCCMHMLEVDEDDLLRVGEISIFVGKNFILSMRSRSTAGFLNVRQRCESEPHLLKHGAGFVLYALMDAVVDRYFPIIDWLNRQLESIENRIFERSSSARTNIEELYDLKRNLMVVQHATLPLLEAVSKLYGGRVPSICVGMGEYYRDIYDHLDRIVKSIESIRDMLNTAIQVNLSMISLDDSAITKKLAAWGALFAVPTMIAGVYGMNFEGMPELKWALGYPMSLGLMAILDIILWRRFKKAGWL
ncbi:magnesium transporter [Chitinivorax tropicus]|uniref:Magnesium transport protein CorA n=1 Tax=Chitinivorax tropicus TaxID=714531 RepID=A0A840MMX5_9PROT|nr:magnesium/cobalt transporter CorA [Chitinivorax tropicus]MBB5017543.1 magnesium transporter [Chitinivorax tropicus]